MDTMSTVTYVARHLAVTMIVINVDTNVECH